MKINPNSKRNKASGKNERQAAIGEQIKSMTSSAKVDAMAKVQSGIAIKLQRKPIAENKLKYQSRTGNMPTVAEKEARNDWASERFKEIKHRFKTEASENKEAESSCEFSFRNMPSSGGNRYSSEAIAK